jgi:hypothetical protein
MLLPLAFVGKAIVWIIVIVVLAVIGLIALVSKLFGGD